MAAKRRPNTDHVVLRYDVDPVRLECTRCGEACVPETPSPVDVYVKRLRAFIQLHADCAERKAG